MNNGQQNGDTLYENGIGWAIMFVIIAVVIWVFWQFFDVEIREMIRWIRYSQMWLISWFVDDSYKIVLENGKEAQFETIFNLTKTYEKEDLGYAHLSLFNDASMKVLKMPIVFILVAGGFWCMFLGPDTQNRRKMSIENLIETQSDIFPVITPFVKFNPSMQPPRPPGSPVPAELPLFAEALGPEEWLAYNSVNPKDGVLADEDLEGPLTAQLGKPWRGVKQLEPHAQILMAAFCLKAARKRIEAEDLLGRLARCWSVKGGLTLSKDAKLLKQAQRILGDKKLAGATLAQANRHGYEATAMLRALQFAREEGGVLAPATFVWLRAHDRNLWYPLNNLGRQSYHMEALGAMSHFKAEKLTQRPIPVPKIEHAMDTIRTYMLSAKARPIPALDYSQSKKRGVKKAV